MHPPIRIQLQTCILRALLPSDAPSLAQHADNRNIWLNLRDRFPHPYTLDDAAQAIEIMGASEHEVVFGIDVGGEIVGTIGLVLRQDVDRVSGELGYWLGESFWGRGIMSDAVRAVTSYGISHHQLTRIFAIIFAWNPASGRVLEKAGYALEGTLKRSAIKDGRVIDQLQYSYVVPG